MLGWVVVSLWVIGFLSFLGGGECKCRQMKPGSSPSLWEEGSPESSGSSVAGVSS